MDQDGSEEKSVAKSRPENDNTKDSNGIQDSAVPNMPWSDMHAYALRDAIPRYTRVLPGKTPKTYTLWRTMMQDVPELSGYPIDFLKEKCTSKDTEVASAPEILPFLDDFYFEPSGGISGQVRTDSELKTLGWPRICQPSQYLIARILSSLHCTLP